MVALARQDFSYHVSCDTNGTVKGKSSSIELQKGEQGFLQRTGNIMRRKRIALADRSGNQLYDAQGRERTWNLQTHRIDERHMVSFVLKPYVYIGDESNGGSEHTIPGLPGAPKMPAGGMNATYYSRLVDRMLLSKPNRS
ncbi:hypothetical protein MVES1_002482 [Malassezia vespertilionis]|uniref:uncharacterized protein n=1 Tax=Malassezia vespertilionis TaxID=2020962 RepID=UPI0024B21D60|nr:uncharacterized protein MVES1_002482 [Malassezia vespertilionis]WFD07125.1 hypothetical protein MVES1_002482 [Malassezia vespertilionis]